MNKKVLITLVLCGLGFIGCATEAQFKKNIEAWIGFDKKKFFKKWGNPARSSRNPESGNTIYSYSFSKTVTTPVETRIVNGVASSTGGDSLEFICKIWVEADEKGIIQQIKWQGNDCVAGD